MNIISESVKVRVIDTPYGAHHGIPPKKGIRFADTELSDLVIATYRKRLLLSPEVPYPFLQLVGTLLYPNVTYATITLKESSLVIKPNYNERYGQILMSLIGADAETRLIKSGEEKGNLYMPPGSKSRYAIIHNKNRTTSILNFYFKGDQNGFQILDL